MSSKEAHGGRFSLTFRLDGLPKMTNSNHMHWRAKAAEARKWKELVKEALKTLEMPPEPLKKAKLILTRHSSQPPDFDGLVSSFKHIIDALTENKVLANDKLINIGCPEYNWSRAPIRKGYVEVVIVDNSVENVDKPVDNYVDNSN